MSFTAFYIRLNLWFADHTPWWFQFLIHLVFGAALGIAALAVAVGVVVEALFIIQNCLWLVPWAALLGAAWQYRDSVPGLVRYPAYA